MQNRKKVPHKRRTKAEAKGREKKRGILVKGIHEWGFISLPPAGLVAGTFMIYTMLLENMITTDDL